MLAGGNNKRVVEPPYPAGKKLHVRLWITRSFLWMSEAVRDLTSHMLGIDNGKVRALF